MKNKKRTMWTIVVTEELDELLEQAVQQHAHVSKSDFVRDVVRRELREMNLL